MERVYIGFVALPAHKEALKRLAQADGETMAVVIRRLIRREAESQGVWPTIEASTENQEARDAG